MRMTTTAVYLKTPRWVHGVRATLVALIVGAATAGAVSAGSGIAAANPWVPTVIGMPEQQAREILTASGTPFMTMVRTGGVSPCIVTEQRNLGYTRTWRLDSSGSRVENSEWKGLALWIRCS